MTIPQLLNADAVLVNPPGNFPLGLVLTPTWDVNIDTLQEFRVCNLTSTALDPLSGAYSFVLFRR